MDFLVSGHGHIISQMLSDEPILVQDENTILSCFLPKLLHECILCNERGTTVSGHNLKLHLSNAHFYEVTFSLNWLHYSDYIF